MGKVMLDGHALLFVRIRRPRTHIARLQIVTFFEFLVPALERVFRRVTQLQNGRRGTFAELDIEPDGSNAVFV